MRLIDADALETHEQLEPMGNGQYEYVEVVYKDDIDDAPTIDAVEVVRCKDCMVSEKFQSDSKGTMERYCKAYTHLRMVADDDYCSYGERRER